MQFFLAFFQNFFAKNFANFSIKNYPGCEGVYGKMKIKLLLLKEDGKRIRKTMATTTSY